MIEHIGVGKRLSDAVVASGLVFIAGQTADTEHGDVEQQTSEVLDKISAFLEKAGTTTSNLLSVQIYLPHIADFDEVNKIYDQWVDPLNLPARACVEARLAGASLRVEIAAIASLSR